MLTTAGGRARPDELALADRSATAAPARSDRAPRLDPLPSARAARRRPRRPSGAPAAQLLDELAGVDAERAGERAGAVGGAGLEPVVLVLVEQPRSTGEPAGWRAISRRRTIRWRGVVVRSRLGQTGSQNPHSTQVVTASSTRGVVFRFSRWQPGSRLRTTPGPSTPPGSARRLIRHIISVAVRAPLALDERRHVDAGAVLGLERAVVAVEDELDELRHERLVALDVLRLGEVGGEHEVEVPGRGVAGDAGQEAVLAEQRPDLLGALGDPRPAARRRPRRSAPSPAAAACRRGRAGPRGPARRARSSRCRRSATGPAAISSCPRGPRRPAASPARARPRRRRRTRPAGPPTRAVELLPVLGRPGNRVGGDHQRRGDHQLDRRRAGGDQVGDRRRSRRRSTRSGSR